MLLRERPNLSPLQEKNTNRYSFAEKRDAEHGAKVAESCGFRVSPFWIGQNIGNLNRFALQQHSAAYGAASRCKCQTFVVVIVLGRVTVACCRVVACAFL